MLSFFSRDVLDEILNLIESVSEGFPTYYLICTGPQSYLPSKKVTDQTVLGKKIVKGVLPYMGMAAFLVT